jgi:hypothetical protein
MKTLFPILYKRATTGKVTSYLIEVSDNKYRTTTGYTDGAKTTTEWTVCKGKNTGRSNETSPAVQAQREAEAKWKKCIEKGYFEDLGEVDTSTIFKPMLANKWTDYVKKHPVKYPIYAQAKSDGIRCICKADGMWKTDCISSSHSRSFKTLV